MRILQVIPYFPPARSFGGSMKTTYMASKELVKRGHDVTIYTTDVYDLTTRLRIDSRTRALGQIDGMKVYYFRNISMKHVQWLKLFVTPELISKARSEIEKFDVIHLREYTTFQNVVIHRYALRCRIPYVLQSHGSFPSNKGGKQKLKWMYHALLGYRILKDAAKIIAVNQVEAEQYMEKGVSSEKISIVPNGIDLSEYENLPPKGAFKRRFNVPEDKKVILYLGRIHKIKGLDFLVKAYAYLTKKMKLNNVLLVIAGFDDGYLSEIQALINSLKMGDTVLLTGPLYGWGKLEAYVDADVYVLPSRYDIWGLTIFEAAACSTPVIVTSGIAINETICEGGFGFSVEYGDTIELAENMHKMLVNDTLSKEMGREGRKFVFENCGWASIVPKLEKVYEQAIAHVE